MWVMKLTSLMKRTIASAKACAIVVRKAVRTSLIAWCSQSMGLPQMTPARQAPPPPSDWASATVCQVVGSPGVCGRPGQLRVAFLRAFREPVRIGRHGRPRLVVEPGLLIGQVIKRYAERRVVSTSRRVLRGTAQAIGTVLEATRTGTGMHTAYIERLNSTFRSHVAPLVRRSRRHRLHAGYLGGWDVAGRHKLRVDLDAQQSPPRGSRRKRPHVVQADSRPWQPAWPITSGPSGTSCPTTCRHRSGSHPNSGPSARAGPATADASGSLTPVPCGATRTRRRQPNAVSCLRTVEVAALCPSWRRPDDHAALASGLLLRLVQTRSSRGGFQDVVGSRAWH